MPVESSSRRRWSPACWSAHRRAHKAKTTVFWGMFISGGSVFLLWFPQFFAAVLPGWVYNVALVIHGEEARLATGFIFTIHFFNSHFRPGKFPMDMVMFTGHVSEVELHEERPGEYDRAAVVVGLVLLALIVAGVTR
jgi:hypothetical protein